jgi:deazaflavin-dependent oxidoreductase (nitroreductase family)
MATIDASELHGDEHVRAYRETDGQYGHDWRRGTSTLLLTTRGRRSGEPRTAALIYGRDGDNYLVVASKGGSPKHPGWYANLRENPEVEVQLRGDRFKAIARTATAEERPRMWEEMTSHWPDYDEYQQRTDREIPVVVLEPDGRNPH